MGTPPSRGCGLVADDIITTVGTMEALHLCLRAVARAGDTVVVESPAYYGLLQLIEGLGMRALEVPAHPRDGMDLAALEDALRQHRVKACLAVPNFSNTWLRWPSTVRELMPSWRAMALLVMPRTTRRTTSYSLAVNCSIGFGGPPESDFSPRPRGPRSCCSKPSQAARIERISSSLGVVLSR